MKCTSKNSLTGALLGCYIDNARITNNKVIEIEISLIRCKVTWGVLLVYLKEKNKLKYLNGIYCLTRALFCFVLVLDDVNSNCRSNRI